ATVYLIIKNVASATVSFTVNYCPQRGARHRPSPFPLVLAKHSVSFRFFYAGCVDRGASDEDAAHCEIDLAGGAVSRQLLDCLAFCRPSRIESKFVDLNQKGFCAARLSNSG